jgi:hypothetical protein
VGTARRVGGVAVALAPEVGGEAVSLGGFALALISLLMWIVLCGLKATWQMTFGAIFESIGGIKIGTWPHKVHPFGFLTDLSHTVENLIGDAAAGYEHAMGFWFHQAAHLQGWLVDVTWRMARDTAHWADWMLTIHLPLQLRWAMTALFPWPAIYRVVRHLIAEALPRISHVAHAAAHVATVPLYRDIAIPHLAEIQWLHRHWKALTAAVAGAGAAVLHPGVAIPRLWRGIDDVESDVRKLAKRVTRTEALFGATAMSLAMANVLGLRSARCLRSGPLGKVSRALCGAPTGLLNDLVGLLADFFILENVCSMLPLLETAASDVGTPLVEVLTTVGAGLCPGASAPRRLRGPAPSIPALIFGVSASGV